MEGRTEEHSAAQPTPFPKAGKSCVTLCHVIGSAAHHHSCRQLQVPTTSTSGDRPSIERCMPPFLTCTSRVRVVSPRLFQHFESLARMDGTQEKHRVVCTYVHIHAPKTRARDRLTRGARGTCEGVSRHRRQEGVRRRRERHHRDKCCANHDALVYGGGRERASRFSWGRKKAAKSSRADRRARRKGGEAGRRTRQMRNWHLSFGDAFVGRHTPQRWGAIK